METDDPAAGATLSYYQENADRFFNNTVGIDMNALYNRFLPSVPAGGHILDAGCGSGRDALFFIKAGYRVTAFDASPALAERASQLIGQPVEVNTFQRFRSTAIFDGVWACASLLHVPLRELPLALENLASYTCNGGPIYVSFKLGSGERMNNGRLFTDVNQDGMTDLIKRLSGLRIQEAWITRDQRQGREDEKWFNSVLVKHE